jgi:hypothetical protein
MQPSDAIFLDTWTFVPQVMSTGNQRSGSFVIQDREMAHPALHTIKPSLDGSYSLKIYAPPFDGDFATATISLKFKQPNIARIILLIGTPIGFGDFGWRGVCAQTLAPHRTLQFDPVSELFVCKAALGKPAPKRLQRIGDILNLRAAFNRIFEPPYLLADPRRPAGVTEDEYRLLRARQKEFDFQVIMASSGLPSPIYDTLGHLDVFATMRNRQDGARLSKDHINTMTARIGLDRQVRADRVGPGPMLAKFEAMGIPSMVRLSTPEENLRLKEVQQYFGSIREKHGQMKTSSELSKTFMALEPILSKDSDAVAKTEIEHGLVPQMPPLIFSWQKLKSVD